MAEPFRGVAFGSLTRRVYTTSGVAHTGAAPTAGAITAAGTDTAVTPVHLGKGVWQFPLSASQMDTPCVTVYWGGTGIADGDQTIATVETYGPTGLTGIPAAVWSHASRTLTGFGTLAADLAAAVWGATTRTLTAISDSAGVTTLLGRLTAGRAAGMDNLVNLDAASSTLATGAQADVILSTTGTAVAAASAALDAVLALGDGSDTIYGEDGALTYTYTVYDTDETTPLPGAAVYVSADEAGAQRSQAKLTDELGRVTFRLDAGPVWFWRSRSDRTFVNPDPETVSEDP